MKKGTSDNKTNTLAPSRLAGEVLAGAITASISLPLCIAAGTLAYSSLGPEYVAEGAFAGILAAIVGGIIASLLRTSSFVVTNPTSPNAVIQASILATLLVVFEGSTDKAILAFATCVVLAGFLQAAIGAMGLARIIKLAPHPVIAGFTSGIGLIIIMAQLPMFFDAPSAAVLATEGPGVGALTRVPFGIMLVMLMSVLPRLAPKVPALLAGLVAGIATFYAARFLAHAVDLGPLVGTVSFDAWSPTDPREMSAILWTSELSLWRIVLTGSATLALLGSLDTVFALRAARNMGDIAVNERRDLIGQGFASVASALTGGLFVSTSMSLGATNYQAGGRTRSSTMAAALLLLAGIAIFPGFIFALPRLVLAAILVVVGYNLLDKPTLRMLRQAVTQRDRAVRAHARRNGSVALAVALATFFGQPILGAGVGVILACVVFMMEMNRPVFRRRSSLLTTRSKRIRSAVQNAILSERGHECAVLELQGVLFFGNADRLATEIEQRDPAIRIVVLDFQQVSNVDASGEAALHQIGSRLKKEGKLLLLSSLHGIDLFRGGPTAIVASTCFVDLDTALEQAEDQLIAGGDMQEGVTELSLERTDFGRTMRQSDLEVLAGYLQPLVIARGTTLSRAGDPSDRLWVITRGSIGIWEEVSGGRRRITSLGAGCVVGEMGLLNDVPRSADICADEDATVHVLTAGAFREILENEPRIGQAVLASIARQLADRLRRTTEELRAAKS